MVVTAKRILSPIVEAIVLLVSEAPLVAPLVPRIMPVVATKMAVSLEMSVIMETEVVEVIVTEKYAKPIANVMGNAVETMLEIPMWMLPDGAIARLGQGIIRQAPAYSPCGKYLVFGSDIGVWWYDISTMTPTALWDTDRGLFQLSHFLRMASGLLLVMETVSSRYGMCSEVFAFPKWSEMKRRDLIIWFPASSFHLTVNFLLSPVDVTISYTSGTLKQENRSQNFTTIPITGGFLFYYALLLSLRMAT
jgi:hypothetical protein